MVCYYHEDSDGRCSAALVAYFGYALGDLEPQPELQTPSIRGFMRRNQICNTNTPFTKSVNLSRFYEVNYTQELPDLDKITKDDTVYFVDYTLSDITIERLLEIGCRIIWIDHHKTSIELCDKSEKYNKIEGIRDISTAGATLTYKYFTEYIGKSTKELPYYIKMVSDYDISRMKCDVVTTLFNQGLETIKESTQVEYWINLHRCCKNVTYADVSRGLVSTFGNNQQPYIMLNSNTRYLLDIIARGKNIQDFVSGSNDQLLRKFGYVTEFEGYKTLVVNCKRDITIFSNKMHDYPLLMLWVFDGDKFCYTIYSEYPEVDCAKIAQKYGGGGHRFAAGFTSEALIIKRR